MRAPAPRYPLWVFTTLLMAVTFAVLCVLIWLMQPSYQGYAIYASLPTATATPVPYRCSPFDYYWCHTNNLTYPP